jgi:hypothetical protein
MLDTDYIKKMMAKNNFTVSSLANKMDICEETLRKLFRGEKTNLVTSSLFSLADTLKIRDLNKLRKGVNPNA